MFSFGFSFLIFILQSCDDSNRPAMINYFIYIWIICSNSISHYNTLHGLVTYNSFKQKRIIYSYIIISLMLLSFTTLTVNYTSISSSHWKMASVSHSVSQAKALMHQVLTPTACVTRALLGINYRNNCNYKNNLETPLFL